MSAPISRLDALRRHLSASVAIDSATSTTFECSPTAAAGGETVKTFKYTVDPSPGEPPILSQAQREFYEENGYLVFRRLVPVDELDVYRRHFNDICEGRAPRSTMMTVMKDVALVKGDGTKLPPGSKGEMVVTKIQHFEDDDTFFQYCGNPDVVRIASAFTGKDIKSVHTMLINKPPDPGTLSSRHPLHQDLHYFPFRPADRIVCSWTAMQTVNRENGCLVVIPGTHKGELLEHGYPDWEGGVNKAYHGITSLGADMRRVHLEMEAGDTVFFHPILIHGSGANRTGGFRKSISAHYGSSHCHYIDVTGTSQEVIAKEVEGLMERKGLSGVSYQELWKIKSRLVGGAEDTL